MEGRKREREKERRLVRECEATREEAVQALTFQAVLAVGRRLIDIAAGRMIVLAGGCTALSAPLALHHAKGFGIEEVK
jgi:hypothetical protein